jgi:hypothetical protein
MSRRKGNYTKSVVLGSEIGNTSFRASGRTNRTPRATTKKKKGAHSCSQVGPSPVLSVGQRMGACATTRLEWVHTARGAWEHAQPLAQRGVHAAHGGPCMGCYHTVLGVCERRGAASACAALMTVDRWQLSAGPNFSAAP